MSFSSHQNQTDVSSATLAIEESYCFVHLFVLFYLVDSNHLHQAICKTFFLIPFFSITDCYCFFCTQNKIVFVNLCSKCSCSKQNQTPYICEQQQQNISTRNHFVSIVLICIAKKQRIHTVFCIQIYFRKCNSHFTEICFILLLINIEIAHNIHILFEFIFYFSVKSVQIWTSYSEKANQGTLKT